jgi:uncharacterized protein YdcH (DUF465 family)
MMHRRSRFALGVILSLATLSGQARAQWGYGYYPYGYGGYGWGGWGQTAQGDIARGLGYFTMGAGIYNHETAIARSINTDTMMRWNQYVYLSQQEATREYFARRNAAIAQDKNAYDALVKRIQENPTAHDIDNGDALNAALDQLSDPRIHSSALRMADTPISARSIRDIPFRNASEAVTFSLSQLKASSQWPAVLLEPRFASERAEFETLVDEIRKENTENGQISPATISNLRAVVARLKDKLAAMPLEDSAENQEALKFVKTVTALARLLEKPEIDEVLNELKKIEKISIGNLLAFMHTFNLRFAPATTPRQRTVYHELYPILDQTRDRIISEAKFDATGTDRAGKAKVHDFFSAMDIDHIEGKKKVPTPPPPGQR